MSEYTILVSVRPSTVRQALRCRGASRGEFMCREESRPSVGRVTCVTSRLDASMRREAWEWLRDRQVTYYKLRTRRGFELRGLAYSSVAAAWSAATQRRGSVWRLPLRGEWFDWFPSGHPIPEGSERVDPETDGSDTVKDFIEGPEYA